MENPKVIFVLSLPVTPRFASERIKFVETDTFAFSLKR